MPEAELTPNELAFLRREMDRRAIEDCLLRYTRGVDRADRELMLSAYHPDAMDEHGVVNLGAAAFVDWAIGWHGTFQTRHQHIVVNHSVELDGDTAHCETYYIFWGINREGPPTLAFGRYVDRFEKRGGEWRIAHRVCVNEVVGSYNPIELPAEFLAQTLATGPNERGRGDISYQRPLVSGLPRNRDQTSPR